MLKQKMHREGKAMQARYTGSVPFDPWLTAAFLGLTVELDSTLKTNDDEETYAVLDYEQKRIRYSNFYGPTFSIWAIACEIGKYIAISQHGLKQYTPTVFAREFDTDADIAGDAFAEALLISDEVIENCLIGNDLVHLARAHCVTVGRLKRYVEKHKLLDRVKANEAKRLNVPVEYMRVHDEYRFK